MPRPSHKFAVTKMNNQRNVKLLLYIILALGEKCGAASTELLNVVTCRKDTLKPENAVNGW